MVADGVTGNVVPVGNPEKLAAGLEPLLIDPQLRRRMGAAGRARAVEMFSSEVTAAVAASATSESKSPPTVIPMASM